MLGLMFDRPRQSSPNWLQVTLLCYPWLTHFLDCYQAFYFLCSWSHCRTMIDRQVFKLEQLSPRFLRLLHCCYLLFFLLPTCCHPFQIHLFSKWQMVVKCPGWADLASVTNVRPIRYWRSACLLRECHQRFEFPFHFIHLLINHYPYKL